MPLKQFLIAKESLSSLINSLIVITACLLVIIWGIPNTMGLRILLLSVGSIFSLIYLFRFGKDLKRAAYIYILFYIWLIVHLLFLANEASLEILSLKNVWFRSFQSSLLGLALGLIISNIGPNSEVISHQKICPSQPYSLVKFPFDNSSWLFILALSFFNIIYLFNIAYLFFTMEDLNKTNFLLGFYNSKVPIAIGACLFLPYCFALVKLGMEEKVKSLTAFTSIIIINFTYFAINSSISRNGLIIYYLNFLFFSLYLIYKFKWSEIRSRSVYLLLISIIFSAIIPMGTKTFENLEYHKVASSIFIGLDLKNYQYWKNNSLLSSPTPPKENFDVSAYQRSAWIKAGFILLVENPLGYGVHHDSFGSLASLKWGDYKTPSGYFRGATESGLLDLALAIGIVGLLLILVPIINAWICSFMVDGIWYLYARIAIPSMLSGYFICEANSEYSTEFLLFMTSFFLGLTNSVRSPIDNFLGNSSK